AALLDMAKQELEFQGFQVLAATNGVEAVNLYQRHKAELDIVVSDMIMPSMDGASLIRKLRLIEPEVPVVAVGSFKMKTWLGEVRNIDVQAILIKPYTPEELLTALSKAFAAKRKREEDSL